MKKKILIVYAHPEPTSLTRHLVEVAVRTLQRLGHEVLLSDLYGMRWKAVFDEHDFPSRADPERHVVSPGQRERSTPEPLRLVHDLLLGLSLLREP